MPKQSIAVLMACLAFGTPAISAGSVSFGPDLAAQGWDQLDFRGRTPASFKSSSASGLSIDANQGVSVLWRNLPRDFANVTNASWNWRVSEGVPATDLSRKGTDDRNIALYFLFGDDDSALDNPPRSLRAAVGKGRALVYVWGGDKAAGSIVKSPYMRGRGQLVIRRPASTANNWVRETADLRADFRRAFGREPGPLIGVAISSDSDDTGARVRAGVSDLTLQ